MKGKKMKKISIEFIFTLALIFLLLFFVKSLKKVDNLNIRKNELLQKQYEVLVKIENKL